MKIFSACKTAAFLITAVLVANSAVLAARPGVQLNVLGTYAAGAYSQGAAEIVTHDPQTRFTSYLKPTSAVKKR